MHKTLEFPRKYLPKNAVSGKAFNKEGTLKTEVQRERCIAAAKAAKDFLLNAPQKIDV